MAVDFINEIYREANLILAFKKIIEFCHKQQHRFVINTWEENIDCLASFCRKTTEWDEDLGCSIWDDVSSIKEYISAMDPVRSADAIEALIPRLYEAISLRGIIDVDDGQYRLFSSKSGFLCVENLSSKRIIMSEIDPAFEAFQKAVAIYEPGKTVFCSLGCELGYLAWQLYEVSNQFIDIYIYETSSKRIEYAREYGVLDWIPQDNLHICIISDPRLLIQEVKKNHLHSMQEDDTVYYVGSEIFDSFSGADRDFAKAVLQKIGTTLNFIGMIENNFYSNYREVDKFVNEIDTQLLSDEWLVIGGGPSVDYNIDFIKKNMGEYTIIAATTVVKKLLKEDIKPDYALAIDMQNRTYLHMEGIENAGIPLIMSDCASWKFGKRYKGKKYLIPTEGMFFSRYVYAGRNIDTWGIGGTVTAAAVEVAVKLGAKKIGLIGLDFAYPDNITHAEGTMDKSIIKDDSLIEVPSVNGGMVKTDLLMHSYIGEIESLIMKYSNVDFFNCSVNGALIRGCK